MLARIATSKATPIKEDTHSFGPNWRQYLKTFGPKEGHPTQEYVIYFIHGGGWKVGSPIMRRPLGRFLVSLGYTVVMPAYRYTFGHRYPELMEDTTLAFRKTLTLDECKDKKFILMGESAGGNLGALLLYDRKRLERANISQDRFAGFLSIAGALDLTELDDSFVLRDYCGPRDGEMFKLANPINYLQPGESTPMLAIQGTDDGLAMHQNAVNFVERLNELSPGTGELFTVEGASHIKVVGDWFRDDAPVRHKVLDWLRKL